MKIETFPRDFCAIFADNFFFKGFSSRKQFQSFEIIIALAIYSSFAGWETDKENKTSFHEKKNKLKSFECGKEKEKEKFEENISIFNEKNENKKSTET